LLVKVGKSLLFSEGKTNCFDESKKKKEKSRVLLRRLLNWRINLSSYLLLGLKVSKRLLAYFCILIKIDSQNINEPCFLNMVRYPLVSLFLFMILQKIFKNYRSNIYFWWRTTYTFFNFKILHSHIKIKPSAYDLEK